MSGPRCDVCGDTGAILGSGPEWCDQYGAVHSEPEWEPCPDCPDEPEDEGLTYWAGYPIPQGGEA